MPVLAQSVVALTDSSGRQFGNVKIERQQGELVFGTFAPGPDFGLVESIFCDFEDAANKQALAAVDALDNALGSLGLQLDLGGSQTRRVHDVQIWSDGTITCRVDSDTTPVDGPMS